MTAQKGSTGFYESVGVDPAKHDVHDATGMFAKGALPGAFVQVHPHPNVPDRMICGHMDGPGTIIATAYMLHKEGAPMRVLGRGAQAAFRMNSEDLAAAGLLGPWWMLNVVNRNPWLLPGPEPLKAIFDAFRGEVEFFARHGVSVTMLGGETADVGDLQGTINVDVAMGMVNSFETKDVIDASRISPGSVIVGLGSFGQCKYETEPTAGARANGQTGLRHGLLSHCYYGKYPETVAHGMPEEKAYQGKYRLEDPLPGDSKFTIGSALTSEVRTYVPYLMELLRRLPKELIEAAIHCSGGGLTKIGGFGADGNVYQLDNLFALEPIFRLAREINGMTDENLCKSLCCGVGMMLVVKPNDAAICIAVAREFGIPAQIIGSVGRKNPGETGRRVEVRSADLCANYDF